MIRRTNRLRNAQPLFIIKYWGKTVAISTIFCFLLFIQTILMNTKINKKKKNDQILIQPYPNKDCLRFLFGLSCDRHLSTSGWSELFLSYFTLIDDDTHRIIWPTNAGDGEKERRGGSPPDSLFIKKIHVGLNKFGGESNRTERFLSNHFFFPRAVHLERVLTFLVKRRGKLN